MKLRARITKKFNHYFYSSYSSKMHDTYEVISKTPSQFTRKKDKNKTDKQYYCLRDNEREELPLKTLIDLLKYNQKTRKNNLQENTTEERQTTKIYCDESESPLTKIEEEKLLNKLTPTIERITINLEGNWFKDELGMFYRQEIGSEKIKKTNTKEKNQYRGKATGVTKDTTEEISKEIKLHQVTLDPNLLIQDKKNPQS